MPKGIKYILEAFVQLKLFQNNICNYYPFIISSFVQLMYVIFYILLKHTEETSLI